MDFENICFIGFGNMSGAVITGILKSDIMKSIKISIYEVDEDKKKKAKDIGLRVCETLKEALDNDILMLAVKPQDYNKILKEIRGKVSADKTIVSFAPGISSDEILKTLNSKCSIIRVMPNMPICLGLGATAICLCSEGSRNKLELVESIFGLLGITEQIEEEKFDAIVSVNASSPVYVYMLSKAMCEYAVSVGVDYKQASSLVFNTIKGSAQMLIDSGYEINKLINMVSSPGGTTISAIKELEDNRFYDIIKRAMEACTKRAKEFSL